MTEGESGDDRQKQKDKTLDPRLLMSRMTEWGESGDDRGGEGEDDRRKDAGAMGSRGYEI